MEWYYWVLIVVLILITIFWLAPLILFASMASSIANRPVAKDPVYTQNADGSVTATFQ